MEIIEKKYVRPVFKDEIKLCEECGCALSAVGESKCRACEFREYLKKEAQLPSDLIEHVVFNCAMDDEAMKVIDEELKKYKTPMTVEKLNDPEYKEKFIAKMKAVLDKDRTLGDDNRQSKLDKISGMDHKIKRTLRYTCNKCWDDHVEEYMIGMNQEEYDKHIETVHDGKIPPMPKPGIEAARNIIRGEHSRYSEVYSGYKLGDVDDTFYCSECQKEFLVDDEHEYDDQWDAFVVHAARAHDAEIDPYLRELQDSYITRENVI